jgi:hypothetical protein
MRSLPLSVLADIGMLADVRGDAGHPLEVEIRRIGMGRAFRAARLGIQLIGGGLHQDDVPISSARLIPGKIGCSSKLTCRSRSSRAAANSSGMIVSLLPSTADFPGVIRERMAGAAGPMSFNAAFPEEAPTGRIDPLLIAHPTEHSFGEGQFGQTRSAPYKLLKMIS